MLSPALVPVLALLAAAAAAQDGPCGEGGSLVACREHVIRGIYATVANPLPVLAGQKPDQWADDVKGRISPIGTFDEYEGTKEYFYGIPSVARPVAVHFTYLLVTEESTYSSVEVEFGSFNLSVTATSNLTQNIVWFFNDANQVNYYDGVVVDVGFFVEDVFKKGILTGNNPFESICQLQAQICTGPLQQYESVTECQQFLAALPLGSWDRGAANSVTCRSIHAILVPFRPEFHCSHIGKTGGGKCVDVDYDDYLRFAVPSNVSADIESLVVAPDAPAPVRACEHS